MCAHFRSPDKPSPAKKPLRSKYRIEQAARLTFLIPPSAHCQVFPLSSPRIVQSSRLDNNNPHHSTFCRDDLCWITRNADIMNYPPILPTTTPSPPRRRPTYGHHEDDDQYDDQYNDGHYNNSYSSPIDSNSIPRRRPVAQPPRISTIDNNNNNNNNNNNSVSSSFRRQDAYGAPPVSARPQHNGRFTYDWPQAAAQAASGYNAESKSTLVYPDEFVYIHPPVPPKKTNTHDGGYPQERVGTDLLDDDGFDNVPAGMNEMYRPLPPRPEPYPPKLHVSPYEQQLTAYPNERFHQQSPDPIDDPFQDPYTERPLSMRRSSSTQNIGNHLEMPTPIVESSKDILHPLPQTPKSPSYMYPLQSPEPRQSLNRTGSGNRPGTRSSTSSMYSYTQDRPIEDDYHEYHHDNDYSASPVSLRSNSFGRSGTILYGQKSPLYGGLRVDTDDLDTPPPLPPYPPPHVEITSPPPRGHVHSNSFSGTPPIYRSRTEPGHYRTASTEPFAPVPPPKVPLNEPNSRPPSLGVLRSQSQNAVKPLPRTPAHTVKFVQEQLAEETPLTPVTDSKSFPLSSKTFQLCTEPWSMSALRTWIQDIFGNSVSMETISLALQGLFTHHVSTLSILQADKLAAQVGTTWIREGILFEPTIANTALWNPLSTLELGFTPKTLQGVVPTLTGKGCYSTRCATTPPGVGRCYSHLCSRTLVKKSMLPPAPTIPTSSSSSAGGKLADWASFWELDSEFLRAMEKREIKRQNIIFEFIQAEEEYVGDLNTMLSWQKQLISSSSTPTPIVPKEKLDEFLGRVFACVKPILDWQTKKLLVPLRERQATQGPVVKGVGDIVLEWVRGCSMIYADYAGGYPLADNLVREETATNPLFASWLEVPTFLRWGLMVAITS